ncbi:MAG: cation:proton antiporter [bacterium]|nr:cation:proton antiporter [bacterium]
MSLQGLTLFSTLLLVFLSAIAGGLLARKLKQPMLLGYIVAGIVVGNIAPRATDRAVLDLISDIGITFLLFTIGVEFSLHRLSRRIRVVWKLAGIQILVCSAVFVLLLGWIGLPFLPSLFIAVACSLSSTAVVVKTLSEKGDLETVPGEIATAWLIVQDLAVVPIMLLLPAIAGSFGTDTFSTATILGSIVFSLLKAGVILSSIFFLTRSILPWVINRIAEIGSREIFLLTTVGIVFFAAAASYALGLSPALGAFIAGLVISETGQNHAVFAEVRPLRDLFAVVFFVSLGMVLPVRSLLEQSAMLVGMTLSVIVVKWIVVVFCMRFSQSHRKTAVFVALLLTQMSEFGFIIAREGSRLGVLDTRLYLFLVALTFSTIFVSTPLIGNSDRIYDGIGRFLRKFPKLFPISAEVRSEEASRLSDHVVLCGYGRVGRYIGRALSLVGIPFVVIDYNHATIAVLRQKGIRVMYGDPADREVLAEANVQSARCIVIAIPDRHTQEMVIGNIQTLSRRVRIICRTHHEEDQSRLRALGVHTIIQPEFEGALSIVSRLLSDFGFAPEDISCNITRLKIEHGVG